MSNSTRTAIRRTITALFLVFVVPALVFAAPSITSLSPTSGAVSASVTIAGSGFGSTQGTSVVKFNGTTATVITSWSSTSIVAKVPTGATTGNVVVTVSGVNSNGKAFTVVAAPSISSLSPTTGAVAAAVTVAGAVGAAVATRHDGTVVKRLTVGQYPNVYPPMGYPGNTARANADTLVHELGHLLVQDKDMPATSRDVSMWPDSGPNEALGQAHNQFLVALKCGSLIVSGFPP